MSFRTEYIKKTRSKKKYRNHSCMYGGFRYDSIKEAQYAEELDWRIKAKEIKYYERQVKFDLRCNGKHITNYYADFVITHNDDEKEVIDVKSAATMTDTFKLKWALLESQLNDFYPDGAIMKIVI